VQPTLQPDIPVQDNNGEEFSSLVMSWDLPDTNELAIANWEYILNEPISLDRSSKIWFSLLPPSAIRS
jgi:hypothetical protein